MERDATAGSRIFVLGFSAICIPVGLGMAQVPVEGLDVAGLALAGVGVLGVAVALRRPRSGA